MPFITGLAAIAGTVGSDVLLSNAANSAAKKEQAALLNASNTEQAQYAQTQGNLQPYITGGQNAFSALQSALGIGTGGGAGTINPAAFQASPGYQFQLQQGLNGVQNAASNTGGVGGGNALKALQSYGSGLANQGWQSYLGNLGGVASSGQNAANSLGSFGANMANQVGQNTINSGLAGAGNSMAQGNIGSSALNNIMKILGGLGGSMGGGANASGGF
jgi:F0F1-type ATP synthase membrane subunit c/vacuolar-type H+-ATPase subunit K